MNKERDNIYDIIIVGGGLSGLYSAYKIHQKYPNYKVLLIESQNHVGGRIETYQSKIYGHVESGAARFNKKHKHVMKLLQELGLDKKINKIPAAIGYMPTNKIIDGESDIKNISKKIIKIAQDTPRQVLQNEIFMDFIKKVLTKDEAQLYYDSFGYSSELTFMNAYDTTELIKNHFMSTEFLNLKDGLYELIERLVEKISKNKNLKIQTNKRVTNIEYNSQKKFEITINEKTNEKINSNICICTLNKETIEHFPIFGPIKPLLKYIKNLPLCRIYSKFSLDKETNEPWFQGKTKFTTNNDLRMVIPMNSQRGTAMISYSDNHYAKSWKKLWDTQGIQAVNDRLHKLIIQSTHNPNIPRPQHTKIFYWEHAVAYYGKGFDSTTMLEKIRKPYPDIPLYVCGENYSEKNNQWMEGALDTVPKILGL